MFVLTKNNPAGFQGGMPTNPTTGKKNLDLSGATTPVLEVGEKLEPFQSTHPTNNYSEPFRLLIRQLGAETGIPLEMLLLDFSTGSFASVRTALIFTQRNFKQHQIAFINRFIMPIFRWRINRWVKERKLPNIPGIYNVNFTLPRWVVIDVLKERMAEQIGRNLGITTLKDWCNENGIDYEEQLDKIAMEKLEFRKRGIPQFSSNTSQALEVLAAADKEDNALMKEDDHEPITDITA